MKPLKLLPSTILFISTGVLLWIMTHLCIPFLSEYTGWEPILFWFICGGLGVFAPLIIAGVMMLRKEGGKFTKETFVERLRFRPMTRRDWSYSLVALVAIGFLTGGIMVAMQALVPDFNHTPSFRRWSPFRRADIGCCFCGYPIGCSISAAKSSFGEEFYYLVRKKLSELTRGYYTAQVGQSFIWRSVATARDLIAIALYRILCGSKDAEYVDRNISARGNQRSKFYRNRIRTYLIEYNG